MKDPAFLFYPGDWQGGTMTMTRFLKGCYMDLLVAQFNNGPLSLEEIKIVLGTDFATAWPVLSKKFKDAGAGTFFNERLYAEMKKRRGFSESRRKNLDSKKVKKTKQAPSPHMGDHMEPHMENESENENGSRDGNENQGGAGGIPAQAAVVELFTRAGLAAGEGENFYLWVSGTKGWGSLHDWASYTEAIIQKKLNEKKLNHGKPTGYSNRNSDQKRGIDALERLAEEILRQPAGVNG